MDFTMHLPFTKRGHRTIVASIDKWMKRVHLVSSRKKIQTKMSYAFSKNVFLRLHGILGVIVFNRDPKFISWYWNHIKSFCNIALKRFKSRHTQTKKCFEFMNWMIDKYLHCYYARKQLNWDNKLIETEFAYNTATVESIMMTPFEADTGWKPRSSLDLLS